MAKFLKNIKNKVVNYAGNKGLKYLLNNWILENGDFGKAIDLQINKQERSISIELELKGEDKTVSLKIDKYHVREGKLIILDVCCPSKEWLDALLKHHLLEKEFDLPESVLLDELLI